MRRFFSGLILACSLLTSPVWADLLDINTASVAELQQNLKGIGKVKAEAIVKHRETYGSFESIEAIKEVRGIGDGLFNTIKEAITVVVDEAGLQTSTRDVSSKADASSKRVEHQNNTRKESAEGARSRVMPVASSEEPPVGRAGRSGKQD